MKSTANPKCPQCGSRSSYKDGVRYTRKGEIQRYSCRKCGIRFSENSNKQYSSMDNRQICAIVKAKNLADATETKTVAGEKSHKTLDIKGKIVQFSFHMKQQGYAESTIRLNATCLKVLSDRGSDLLNPESVKTVISRQKWSENRKRNIINAYTLFLKLNGMAWKKPKCRIVRKFPFIPTEQEIDALISGSSKKLSTFLQLIKETAMRSGEARIIQWVDVDFQKNIITLNKPEKGSNPRMWRVSSKLIAMLNTLPRKN